MTYEQPAIFEQNQLIVENEIARGNFGIAFKGVLFPDKDFLSFGIDVAAKKMHSEKFNLTAMMVERENLEYIKNLNHENLVAFIGAVPSQDGEQYYLCTELCDSISLKGRLNLLRAHGTVPHNEQLLWAKEICSGMQCLETHNVKHCDLAARNVLFKGKKLKIADFGLANRSENEYMDNIERAWAWHAPETFSYPTIPARDGSMLYPKPIYTTKSDSWSYGVVLWEICTTGLTPYQNKGKNEIVPKMVDEGYRLSFDPPFNGHPKLKEIIPKCWIFEPPIWKKGSFSHSRQDSRPSFADIQKEF